MLKKTFSECHRCGQPVPALANVFFKQYNSGIFMTEQNRGARDIGNIPPECVPFGLLTSREQEVLQHISDGHSLREIAGLLDSSESTVTIHRHNIGLIGETRTTSWVKYSSPGQGRHAVIALIQDGITQGYLKHTLPEEPIKPLTPREEEMLELFLQGKSNSKIARESNLAEGTVMKLVSDIRAKLHTYNIYDTVARATYLRVHGMWPSVVDG